MNRRSLLRRSALGLATLAGFMVLPPARRAAADAPPHVSKDDPTAKTLNYSEDAAHSARTAADAFCHTCRFFKGTGQAPWGPCDFFPGKAVNVNGWCSMWNKKS